MNQAQKMARRLFESKVAIHAIFIVSFLFLFCLPAFFNGLPVIKIIKVPIYGTFLLMCLYAGRWCCRRWLLTNKFGQFILYGSVSILILCMIGIAGLRLLTYNHILAIVITVLGFAILFFFLGLFLSITRTTILRQLSEASIIQQQKESEIQFLRSQLSPHFLFNILNNLYGLSITQHKKIPDLLLKLSDLLRYSIYDTKQDFVPLHDELEYIENYIELEKTRMGDRLLLNTNIQKTNIEAITIAPMLLIVFVENAFKHSKNTFNHNIWVNIDLQIIDDDLLFTIRNSCGEEKKETNRINEESGMGLSVTLKRLDLLYPGRYFLDKTRVNGYYEVKLQLKVK